MVQIQAWQLPCSEQDLRAALKEYEAALEAHKMTVGVPAPWPRYECLFEIVRRGDEFEVVQPAPEVVEPSARDKAMVALLAKRAAETKLAEDRMLAHAALEPDAPQELKDYVAANPEIAALAVKEPVKSMPVVDTSKL